MRVAERVELWDRCLASVRAWMRQQGLREVSTPAKVHAPAIEPFIEPIAAGRGYLATSPELAMKRLLASGSGSIFQLAHVFRSGERGDRHAEEFHLLEWYRVAEDGDAAAAFAAVQRDVESIVALVHEAARELGHRNGAGSNPRWERVDCLALMGESLGIETGEFDSLGAVESALARVRRAAGPALGFCEGDEPHRGTTDDSVRALQIWTELFSLWSDQHLDPWLARKPPGTGVHLHSFPPALAALAEVRSGVAQRCESHVEGVELANGYLELRDADEQRARFERVNALRKLHGADPLPLDESFLACLREPGLPACAGMALGLDRLLMVACGCQTLADIALDRDGR